jgi:hypothetical protein
VKYTYAWRQDCRIDMFYDSIPLISNARKGEGARFV